MNEHELLALLADIESDRIERTVSTRDLDKFCVAICAFSNDFPQHRRSSYLLIGVHNDGQPSGLTVTDELLQELGGIRSSGSIMPRPAIAVQKHTLSDGRGDIAVIEVIPSDLPPVRYKGQVWIRVGPRRAIASETEERLLSERRAALAKTFDAQPCVGLTLADLSLDLFLVTYRHFAIDADTLAENHRVVEEQLSSLRFYDLTRNSPTFAGILLFGSNPLDVLPGAYIQFVRFQGTSLADDVTSEKTLSGDLLTVLRELDDFLPLQIQTYPEPDSALRERLVSDYPLIALRELTMNAVMHRLYETNAPVRIYWFVDRIEIHSPGGLYGLATPENFPRQNDYRNPIIAEAMKVLGYVNKYARGVVRAQAALAQNGNCAPTFDLQPTAVLVTVWRRP